MAPIPANLTKPLESLEELSNWEATDTNLKDIPRLRKVYSSSKNKILLCHDMMGGYLDDKYVDGTSNCDAYRFFHWSKLDTFVYFSHNFITIPPYCWTIAGHKHGVKVLGTIITEWEKGAKICQEILKSKESVDSFCEKICKVTKHYGFDGWLLNIENPIEENSIEMLVYLAKTLTFKMHQQDPNSEIIWYDSVISTGDLKWQDELNCLNRIFFDVTDGIFLNYNWNIEKLQNTRDLAQDRYQNVYIGIDVFGRGKKQVEGLECHKTIQEACDSKMSLAIFAPGWVYEVLGKEEFTSNECKFWSLLCELLPSKAFCDFPLETSFCQGFGLKKFQLGQVVEEESWHNLSLQELQPSFPDKNSYKGFEFCLNDAFNGGNCLKYHGELSKNEFIPQNTKDFRIFLFKTEVLFQESSLIVSYTFKTELGEADVGILLETKDSAPNLLLTDVGEEFEFEDTIVHSSDINEIKEKYKIDVPIAKEETKWITRCYVIQETNGNKSKILDLRGISIRIFSKNLTKDSNFSVLLGEFRIVKVTL